MLKESITGRDGYILAMALIFTIEVLEKLPEDRRPDSAIKDMKDILASVPRAIVDAADMDINASLLQVVWEPPDRCQEGADQLSALVSAAETSEGVDVAALCEQAENVLRSLLHHAQHEYQRNLSHAAVDAVIAYLKAGQFSEPWRRHGVDMALAGLRKVGSARRHLGDDKAAHTQKPRYNIRPTTTIDAVIKRGAKRELVPMRRLVRLNAEQNIRYSATVSRFAWDRLIQVNVLCVVIRILHSLVHGVGEYHDETSPFC